MRVCVTKKYIFAVANFTDRMNLNELTHIFAAEVGFDKCAIAECKKLDSHVQRLESWLERGYAADMDFLKRNCEKRYDPSLLVENGRTIIVCLVSYNAPKPDSNVARYARVPDYHYTVRDMLMQLKTKLQQHVEINSSRVFCDSAPVMERSWAAETGLGWIGRNGMLVNQELGSFTIIGSLIIDAQIEPDAVAIHPNRCGNCTRCVSACPTGAILPDRTINANRCLAYHTIENRGEIPQEIAANLGVSCFGCDICQEVCPWNSKAKMTKNTNFLPHEHLCNINPEELSAQTDSEFKAKYRDSSFLRSGRVGLLKNFRK